MAPPNPNKLNKATQGMRYYSLGFQIVGTFAAGVLLGWWLDKQLQTRQPYFTAGLGVLFAFIGLYLAFKDLLKPKKKE